jgi:MFS family permease
MNTAHTIPPTPSHFLNSLKAQMVVLFSAQALLLTSNVTFIAINALAGASLASTPMLATLPIAMQALASALSSYPASQFMSRFGRRWGFTLGAALGLIGSLLAAWGMVVHSLTWLCMGTFLAGVYNGMGQYLRFAAADAAQQYKPSFKSQAIAIVLAGGVVGGVIGPEAAKLSRTALDTTFLATYLSLSVFAVFALMLVQALRLSEPAAPALTTEESTILSVRQVFSNPTVLAATLCAAVAYGCMNLLMVATPLAMQVCGFSFNDTAWVIEWHVIAMFAPGFFTGRLNDRFGVRPMMFAGGALLVLAACINLNGISFWHFWWALLLLGLGWNWLFTGATTLLTSTYNAANKARVQGLNDTVVFSTLVFSSLSSGVLVASYGWQLMNAVSVVVVAAAMVALWRLGIANQQQRQAV